MKKYVTASLFIFWAITVAVIVAGLISYDTNNQSTNINSISFRNISGIDSSATSLMLSKNELSKHNSRQSCWLLISGKIYDITTYMNQHPGGVKEILPTCGTDATKAYTTRGGTGSHSSSATAMLTAYYIGDLGQTITANSVNKNIPTAVNSNLSSIQNKNDEEENDD
ncbi:MAG: cytochrome b5-like heme/steroid binding domain-containing protein [Candidatus Paceibacterota bacterium]|jgi:cytochrome b involved in lipid metabolism